MLLRRVTRIPPRRRRWPREMVAVELVSVYTEKLPIEEFCVGLPEIFVGLLI